MGVGWWVLILIGLAFLVAVLRGTLVKVDGRREEVAVLRDVDLASTGGLDLALICWLLVFFLWFFG